MLGESFFDNIESLMKKHYTVTLELDNGEDVSMNKQDGKEFFTKIKSLPSIERKKLEKTMQKDAVSFVAGLEKVLG